MCLVMSTLMSNPPITVLIPRALFKVHSLGYSMRSKQVMLKIILFLTCLVTLAQACVRHYPQDHPKVCSSTGSKVCYKGVWQTSDQGSKYASFYGLRYALPPVKDLRFKAPQAYRPKDNSDIDASNSKRIECPQANFILKSVLKGIH